MPRSFNTTGPCDLQRHYLLPPERTLPNLERFFVEELYFVLHAPRQTGKTTAMRALAQRLRERGMVAVWTTLEGSQGVTETAEAEPIWLDALENGGRVLPKELRPPDFRTALERPVGTRLKNYLQNWAASVPAPLILLLDEADTLSGPALISFLRQLRAGFQDRGVGRFPTSIALIGMRDLRDYLTHAKDGVAANPGSPFNIKKNSLTLRNFREEEIAELYAQHTEETGQVFLPEAIKQVHHWTRGQPFLVNAFADICVHEMGLSSDTPITPAHILAAKEKLILSRTTHLDSLGERLKQERVAKVIQEILTGDEYIDYSHDDWQYCMDLGLTIKGPDGAEISNPLYREVLARELSYNQQIRLKSPWWKWQKADGKLDIEALMDEFLKWWRANEGAVYAHGNPYYPEALPHLTFMAFLQRVVNGGGQVLREFAAGRGAIDLVVEYAGERHVIELKRIKDRSREAVVEEGLRQLGAYLETVGENVGWLIVFDPRKGQSWDERLWRKEVELEGRRILLRGA